MDLPWDDFVSHAIGASVLAEYWYCAPKLVVKQEIGEISTPETIKGARLHEEEAQRVLSELGPLEKIEKPKTIGDAMIHSFTILVLGLRNRLVIANSEKSVLFRTIIPELGIIGLPDKADCTNGKQPVLVESKYVAQLIRGNRPWSSHEFQVAAYMLGLEVLSFKPTHAIVEYIEKTAQKQQRFEVRLTDSLRQKVTDTALRVRRILAGEEDPIPPTHPNKCRQCHEKYRERCRFCLI